MFRKALRSVFRVSLCVSSCVCHQLSLFIRSRTLFCFPLVSLTHTHIHMHTPYNQDEKHNENFTVIQTNTLTTQYPEKVQSESRCQFSHAALMGARMVNISTSLSRLLALAFLTLSAVPTVEEYKRP